MWIGLGVGGLILLLCCVGGVFGLGVVYVASTDQAKKEAATAVAGYLDDLRDRNFGRARARLCVGLAGRLTQSELAAQARQRAIVTYELGDAYFSQIGVDVPAHLTTSAGPVEQTFALATEGSALRICEIRE